MCIRFVKVYLGVIIGSLFLMFTSCSEDLNSVSIVKGCEGFLYIKDRDEYKFIERFLPVMKKFKEES